MLASEAKKMAKRYGAFAVIAAVCLIIGLTVLGNEFINYDDPKVVLEAASRGDLDLSYENLVGAFLKNPSEAYMPMRTVLLMFCHALGGTSPWIYHLAGLLLYAATGILVYLLVHHLLSWSRYDQAPSAGELSLENRWALFAAVLYCSSPMNVESLAWVSASKDLLLALFFLGAVVGYIRGRQGWKYGYQVCAACFFLALLSKPVALVLPVVLAAYELCRERRAGLFKLPWRLAAVLALVALPMAVYVVVHLVLRWGYRQEVTAASVAAGALKVFFSYIGAFLVPVGLSVRYLVRVPLSLANLQTSAHFLLLLAVVCLVIFAWRRGNRLPAFALAWVLAVLLPSSGIVPLEVLRADRYALLAVPMYAAVLADFLRRAERRGKPGLSRWGWNLTAWLVPLFFAALFVQRLALWRNSETLWEDALAKDQKHFIALKQLGAYHAEKGDTSGALVFFNRALEANPSSVDAMNALGKIFEGLGREDNAESYYQKAAGMPLNRDESLFNLGTLYLRQGRLEFAEEMLFRSARIKPNPRAYYQLSVVYQRLGNPDRAMFLVRQALDQSPRDPVYLVGLARLLTARGEPENAAPLLEEALRRDPGFMPVYLGLGEMFDAGGKLDEARETYRAALRRWPGDTEVLLGLADAYRRLKQPDSAEICLERVLETSPGNCEALSGLTAALMMQEQLEKALATARSAIACDSLKTVNYLNSYFIYLYLDSLQRGEQMIARALSLHPEWPAGLYIMARLSLDPHRDTAAARQYLGRYLELEPDPELRRRGQVLLDSLAGSP